jgi:cystine transport system substrate-binding protein
MIKAETYLSKSQKHTRLLGFRKEFPMKRTFTYLLMLLIAMIATACSVQTPKTEGDLYDQVKKRGTLIVGTEGTYKPFSYHDEKTNELTGFDVEVAKEIGKRLGVKVEFKEIPWDGMLTSLQTRKIDMVANQVGIKPERKEKFDFSQPYTISYAQIFVHQDKQ